MSSTASASRKTASREPGLIAGRVALSRCLAPSLLGLAAISLQGCLLLEIRPVGDSRGVERKDLPRVSRIEGDRVFKFLAPDRIPSIDQPVMVIADRADFMRDDELVLGVQVGGEARAYSLWHLDRHEVVNDTISGSAIAATW